MSVQNKAKTTKKLGGVTGKGFMPGKSGNPGGRPKKTVLSDAYRAVLEREVPDDPKGRTFAELIADQIALDAIKGRNKVSAAAELADRTEGKVKETHEISITPLDITVRFVKSTGKLKDMK